MADEIPSKREDRYALLKEVTHAHYPEQVKQGYTWNINSDPENVSEHVKRFESEGLESFVGDVGFDTRGERIIGVAILTRKKAQS